VAGNGKGERRLRGKRQSEMDALLRCQFSAKQKLNPKVSAQKSIELRISRNRACHQTAAATQPRQDGAGLSVIADLPSITNIGDAYHFLL